MLRKLDTYVVSSLLADFVVTAFALSGMFVVIDLFQNLGRFIVLGPLDAAATVLKYYAFFVPINIPDMFPAITLIGAGLTLARHSKANELLAMKASGISMYRVMVPIFVCACLLAIVATLNREWVVPKFWQKFDKLQRTLGDSVLTARGTVEDPVNNMVVRVWEYDRKKGTMKTIDIWQHYDNKVLKFWIKAERGQWKGSEWHLSGVMKHDFSEDNKPLGFKRLQTYIIETSLAPKDLEVVSIDPSALSFFELRQFCKDHPESHLLHVNLHERAAYPLKGIVLLLLGIPFMVGFDGLNRSRFMGILNCVIVCAVFYTLGFVASHFGINGRLHPILAAWIPTIMFGAVGLLLFDSMRT